MVKCVFPRQKDEEVAVDFARVAHAFRATISNPGCPIPFALFAKGWVPD